MGRLSTHVLDTVQGRPAAGVAISLHRIALDSGERMLVTSTVTNADGRTDAPLLAGERFVAGTYEIAFAIGDYFRASGAQAAEPGFLEIVPVRFQITETDAHYHVPLLASPWAYSTYRGS